MKQIKWHRKGAPTERGRASVEAILQAAVILLYKKYYSEISLGEIIDKSGVGATILYRYYESLEHLYADVLENFLEERRQKDVMLWRIGGISILLPIAHKFKINVVPDTKDDNELLLFYKLLMDWDEDDFPF